MNAKSSKIYITGHKDMVGSAVMRALKAIGYSHVVGRTSKELDLRNHKLLNIAQSAQERCQFIVELEREITHPLGVHTHTRKLLISQGILCIC